MIVGQAQIIAATIALYCLVRMGADRTTAGAIMGAGLALAF